MELDLYCSHSFAGMSQATWLPWALKKNTLLAACIDTRVVGCVCRSVICACLSVSLFDCLAHT